MKTLGGLLKTKTDKQYGADIPIPDKEWMSDLFDIASEEAKAAEEAERNNTATNHKPTYDKYVTEVSYAPPVKGQQEVKSK